MDRVKLCTLETFGDSFATANFLRCKFRSFSPRFPSVIRSPPPVFFGANFVRFRRPSDRSRSRSRRNRSRSRSRRPSDRPQPQPLQPQPQPCRRNRAAAAAAATAVRPTVRSRSRGRSRRRRNRSRRAVRCRSMKDSILSLSGSWWCNCRGKVAPSLSVRSGGVPSLIRTFASLRCAPRGKNPYATDKFRAAAEPTDIIRGPSAE